MCQPEGLGAEGTPIRESNNVVSAFEVVVDKVWVERVDKIKEVSSTRKAWVGSVLARVDTTNGCDIFRTNSEKLHRTIADNLLDIVRRELASSAKGLLVNSFKVILIGFTYVCE